MFAAPWERRLFGVTMALHERGVFAWRSSAHLIDEIALDSPRRPRRIRLLRALERAVALLDQRGVIDPAAVGRARERSALPPGRP